MKRTGGARRKTRSKMRKNVRTKGKISLTRYFRVFENGAKVNLVAEPSVQKGMYYPRFHGMAGIVTGKKGRCYEVEIKDHRMKKTVIVHPVHLKVRK